MNDEAREELVRLLPRLRRFAFGLTGKLEDADDLVQAACERALDRFHQWQPGTRLDSWMFRIIQTVFIDTTRKHKLRGNPVDLNDYSHLTDPGAQRRSEARSALSQVAEAMALLPEEQRIVLMLVCIEEHSYREAAALIGVPVGTVMSRLARARLRLSELLHDGASVMKRTSAHG
jgi:RNA polymerase sigma-70 factor, ECF subfamily